MVTHEHSDSPERVLIVVREGKGGGLSGRWLFKDPLCSRDIASNLYTCCRLASSTISKTILLLQTL